jgi:hypothetical protein
MSIFDTKKSEEKPEEKKEELPEISETTKEQLDQASKKDRTLSDIILDLLKRKKEKKQSVLYDEFLPG